MAKNATALVTGAAPVAPNAAPVVVTPSADEIAAAKAVLAAARANRPARTVYGNTVTLLDSGKPVDRLPRQCRVILRVLAGLGGTASVNELVNALTAGGLETVQEPKRIFAFYRARLVLEGYISC